VSDVHDFKLPLTNYEDAVREVRARKPFCPYCGKKKPDDPNLHHVCAAMSLDFIRGVRELAETLKKEDEKPGAQFAGHSREKCRDMFEPGSGCCPGCPYED
jgi:hypothetical protein